MQSSNKPDVTVFLNYVITRHLFSVELFNNAVYENKKLHIDQSLYLVSMF